MKRPRFEELILLEDDDMIVVNKPPFISTLEDRNDPFNLLSMGRAYFPELQACHRLDKQTSGCLIMAKTPEVYRHISLQFQNQLVDKTYHAVVEGQYSWDADEIDAPIYIRSSGGAKVDQRRGKEATTVLRSIEAFKHHTVVECKPRTGRLHQIRVHLASVGAPIVGDLMYGGHEFYLSSIKPKYTASKHEERPLIRRLALHAHRLMVTGPSGKKVDVKAEYPKDFQVLILQLQKHG